MTTTRTIGPLHLEDLEPHRFEDLIRQLIYDLRNWRVIEATGRSGSDDGFDARATEIVPTMNASDSSVEDEADDSAVSVAIRDRVWLIQCKREKSIGPKKLVGYLDDIPESARQGLHGIVFAAACDFSKAARDAFRDKSRDFGFSEAYLWGKGEIEDLLFQPKNDHLLFAYFGVSLQVRRRSLRTEVRSRLAAKRKALRLLKEFRPTLIRDATDERYPYLEKDDSKSRFERGRWTVLSYVGAFSDGLHFVCDRHFAYLAPNGVEWDYAECMNDGRLDIHQNPWRTKAQEDDREARFAAMEIWEGFPPESKAWYQVFAILPYENIIDIDEHGDEFIKDPQIYTTEQNPEKGPFLYFRSELQTISSFDPRYGAASEEMRVVKFPRRSKKELEK